MAEQYQFTVELKLLDSDKFNQITSRGHRFGKQILRKNQAKNKQKKFSSSSVVLF